MYGMASVGRQEEGKNPNFMAYQFRSLSYKFAEEGKFSSIHSRERSKIKRGNINYWRSLTRTGEKRIRRFSHTHTTRALQRIRGYVWGC